MATIARCTPSFALPATQNTAPVHEFKCLYTHDIRKKAKKWHDGSARFHTFNKRVMVYDDTKSYIGDLHYRADEEFDEGVELQLDRGVLVEVGERVGQTHTDLTGIINRPHAEASSPSAASTVTHSHPVQRINAVHSQGRPKSLSELLGPSQGRTGRARLPLQSPFEQRHSLNHDQHDEPRSKRRKMSSGKENEHPMRGYSNPVEAINNPAQIQRTIITPSVLPKQDSLGTFQSSNVRAGVTENVIDISSDEEAAAQAKKAQPLSKRGDKFTTTDAGNRSVPSQRPKLKTPAPSHDNGVHSGARSTSADQCREISSNTPNASNASKPRTSQLRMVSQKPRRKLMYRALLPASIREEDSYCSPKASTEAEHRTTDMSAAAQSPVAAQDNDAVGVDENPRLDDFNGPRNSSESPCPPPETLETPRQLSPIRVDSTSPLFVSQSLSQQSPSKSQQIADIDFSIPATQELFARASASPKGDIFDAMDIDGNDVISEPDSPTFPQPPHRSKATVQSSPEPQSETDRFAEDVTVPKESLLHNNRMAQAASNPSLTAFRSLTRSLSENEGLEVYDPQSSPSRALVNLSAPLNKPRVLPPYSDSRLLASRTDEQSKIRSPIQHSRSDPVAIIPHAVAPSPPPPVSNEQGPWTEIEAFLLFDTWPHCKAKDKPVFERLQDSEPDVSDDEAIGRVNPIPANRAFHPVIIRSARHVLRDDY